MPSLSFAIPVKPGMYDEIKSHHDEIVHGLEAEDHHHHHRGRGIKTVQIFYQESPTELLIFHIEGDDEAELMRSASDPDSPIRQTWQQFLSRVAGEDRKPVKRPELMIDWHHHEGHRKRHR